MINNQDTILIHKLSKLRTLDNQDSSVLFITSSVASFLADEIEELNTNATIFRSGLQRCVLNVLKIMETQKDEHFFIFPNSIPGFTLIVVRKNNENIKNVIKNAEKIENKKNSTLNKKSNNNNHNNKRLDDLILERIMNIYFKKNEEKILLVENVDVVFAFFPLADTRKNLKELELYITY